MANTYLTRTIGSGSAGRTFTISFWLKISSTSANHTIVGLSSDSNSTKYVEVALKSNHKLDIQFRNGTSGDNGTYLRRRTNRLFRDTNAWYHIVVRVDSTQSSASDRFRLYINGEQETSIDVDSTAAMPQNYVTDLNNNGSTFRIGRGAGSSSYYLDGYLSHFHFADGQSLAPTVFGSTDSTTGEWKINASPTFTPGTEGFSILKDGNTITDQSANSNNFTLGGGTLTKTEDNPSNVFATFNPLFIGNGQASTLTKGNTQAESPTSQGIGGTSTLAANSGKFYAEFLYVSDTSGSNNEGAIGVCDTYFLSSNASLGGSSSPGYQEYSVANWGLRNANNTFYSSSGSKYTNSNQHGSWTLNDIIGVALDIDSNRVYFSKNGGWWNGTSSWGGASPTNYITLDSTGFEGRYHFAVGDSSSGNSVVWRANFGNGYFGTTAVSSAGTNASGLGIFEYDVPTGYTALCTKGLNE